MDTAVFVKTLDYGFQGIVILALGWCIVFLYQDLQKQRDEHNKKMTELGQRMDEKDEKCRQERMQSQEIMKTALDKNTYAVDRLCKIIDQTKKKR